ncbi:MAG TPA: hypothetical protein VFV37_03145 [Luteibaculaceae bacterium]|nr:hypothetical protein [Luteibaculaceae bacterium]
MSRILLILLLLTFCHPPLHSQRRLTDWNYSGTRVTEADLLLAMQATHRIAELWQPADWESYHKACERDVVFEKKMSYCELLEQVLVLEQTTPGALVVLNGRVRARVDSYFYPTRLAFKSGWLREMNTLQLVFPAKNREVARWVRKQPFLYPADSDNLPGKPSVYLRQPAYFSGWDFTPAYPRKHARKVSLEAQATQWSVQWRPVQRDGIWQALVSLDNRGTAQPINLHLQIEGLFDTTLRVFAPLGTSVHAVVLDKPAIQPWHPDNPVLYPSSVSVLTPDVVARRDQAVGFSHIELMQPADSAGRAFYFQVNGRPMYCTGFNAIANEQEFTRDAIAQLRKAGFNMIRIWGGGDYASDSLMTWCDELGMLVWHDLAFANTIYPFHRIKNKVFLEVQHQLKRLQTHPSLALWCGNNEVDVAWKNWGWQRTYGYRESDSVALYGEYLEMQDSLARWIQTLDGRSFLPSSPVSNWGKKSDFLSGDNHFWGVYHGDMPIDAYRTHLPRFASEYGMQSYPWPVGSPRFDSLALSHPLKQRSYKGVGALQRYLHQTLSDAIDTIDFIYKSQVVQALAMREALWAHRYRQPFCMGSLIWQYNDVWPGASWSLIDYLNRPKIAWYEAVKTIDPQAMHAYFEGDSLLIEIAGPTWPDSVQINLYNGSGWVNRISLNHPSRRQSLAVSMATVVQLTGFKGSNRYQTLALRTPASPSDLPDPQWTFVRKGLHLEINWIHPPLFPVIESDGQFQYIDIGSGNEKTVTLENFFEKNTTFRVHHLKGRTSVVKLF